MPTRIHPTAIVETGAALGADVVIGAFAFVGPQVNLGDGTVLHHHATVEGLTTLGAGCEVYPHACVGLKTQDLKFKGGVPGTRIGDRNVFREFCTINRGTTHDKGVTHIGNDNLFMSYTHVAHDCVLGDKIVMANCAQLAGHVHLGDWVIMGGFSGVHQFCKVGAHAFIGNSTAVTRDVPPFVMAVGQPAEPHSINSEGLKRRGYSEEQIRNLRNAYRVLYRSDLKLADAVVQLTELGRTQPEVRELVEFIGTSTRSLVR
jgi:UDP-N-acetylglucosamine acyltransferase